MKSLVVLFAVVCGAFAAPHVEKRSVEHAVAYSLPSAVSHQSRVDVRSSPAVVTSVVEPVVAARAVVPAAAVYSAPTVYSAPAVYAAPAAVSHQSRVDVRTSPAVSASVYAPFVAEPVVAARAVYPAATTYVGGSAVSHQSRVDVESSPAVVSHQVVSPVVEARSAWAPSVYSSVW